MESTALSMLPPIITIILALLTKEVYTSLIVGIFVGAMLFTGGNFLESIVTFFEIMEGKVGGRQHSSILSNLGYLGCDNQQIGRNEGLRGMGALSHFR